MPPGSSNPDPISAQNMSFSTPVFRSLKSIPVFRPGLLAEIMSLLLRLEHKQKNSSNPFRIRIFLFLSLIWPINTFIHSRSSLKNHTRFQTKMGQYYTRFQTKKAKKPHPAWGDAYLYSLYKGVPPPPRWLNVHDLHIHVAVAVSKINIFRVARVSKTTFVRRQGDLATSRLYSTVPPTFPPKAKYLK